MLCIRFATINSNKSRNQRKNKLKIGWEKSEKALMKQKGTMWGESKGPTLLIPSIYPIFEPWRYQEATIIFEPHFTQMQKLIIVEKEYSITYSLNFCEKKCQKFMEKDLKMFLSMIIFYQLFNFLDRGCKNISPFNVKSLLGCLHTTQH